MIIREIQNKLCRGENRTNNADEPRQPMEYAGETKIFISGFECIATDMPYPALCTTAIDNEVFNKSKNCEFCIFRCTYTWCGSLRTKNMCNCNLIWNWAVSYIKIDPNMCFFCSFFFIFSLVLVALALWTADHGQDVYYKTQTTLNVCLLYLNSESKSNK